VLLLPLLLQLMGRSGIPWEAAAAALNVLDMLPQLVEVGHLEPPLHRLQIVPQICRSVCAWYTDMSSASVIDAMAHTHTHTCYALLIVARKTGLDHGSLLTTFTCQSGRVKMLHVLANLFTLYPLTRLCRVVACLCPCLSCNRAIGNKSGSLSMYKKM